MKSKKQAIVSFPKAPQPDFQGLIEELSGRRQQDKVRLVEWFVDYEVVDVILREHFDDPGPPLRKLLDSGEDGKVSFLTSDGDRLYVDRVIKFYHMAGYDCLADHIPLNRLVTRILQPKMPSLRVAPDTAALSRGTRTFAEEGRGIVQSREDLERFFAAGFAIELDPYYEYLSKRLPPGMKVMVGGSFFEQVLERLLGYEGLFFLLHDQLDLVAEAFARLGELVYRLYEQAIDYDCVGGIFHADDLGFRTATMLSPADLKRFVFPWFKRYGELAHGRGKAYWYHSCGNLAQVMDTLIDEVRIDAFHSFQDAILPVGEFKRRYGQRVATLGGIDVDKLSRLDEPGIRAYIRDMLEQCMPGGRFALSSGNSVPNYAPVDNYLAVLDEAYRWGERR